MSSTDDLSTSARIRAAALELLATEGLDKPTVRRIAERAGVSPGLVIHHYGSRDGLVAAVDAWVLERITEEKILAARSGVLPSMAHYEDLAPEYRLLLDYVTQQLRVGGPLARRVFDDIVGHTRQMLDAGVASGMLNAPSDADAYAAVMTAFALGMTLLERETAPHLGGENLTEPEVMRRYSRAALEMFTKPLFTDPAMIAAMFEENNQ